MKLENGNMVMAKVMANDQVETKAWRISKKSTGSDHSLDFCPSV